MSSTIPGSRRRANVMKERWANGQNATNYYRARLAGLVKSGMSVLHAGCGWDKNNVSGQLKDICRVVGVDLDPRIQKLFHSDFYLASLEGLPFKSETFDVVFSEYVFEHLTDPESALAELGRVLKSSGVLLILTPNLYSYKTIASKLTPQWFHVTMGRLRYGRGHEADMYPTVYRCNTQGDFNQLAKRTGLIVRRIDMVTNGPTWFEKIPGVFGLFNLFHVAIRKWDWASCLRCALIVELYKP